MNRISAENTLRIIRYTTIFTLHQFYPLISTFQNCHPYIPQFAIWWFIFAKTRATYDSTTLTLKLGNILSISFKFYMWVDNPLRYFTFEIGYSMSTRKTANAIRYVSPKSLKCKTCISISNGPIALKFNTGVIYQKLNTNNCPGLD